ncbi:hypothetical protein [Aureispira anguillae]|uniref:Uncharacterized protein n=1 Tax=Aureispira anguillae TaxID=2864201 RepID=A0A916DPQ8_9BACT|nr:hypothetical protein [Aureispira anguillae]BDS10704.1 hypothetical protein AsAng_0014130 [Aureispira anguillae]
MDLNDFGWEHKPPEYETGDYWFDGKFLVSQGVQDALSGAEIFFIYAHIINLVQQHQGIDYVQVFEQKEKGYKLFFLDQVTRESLQIGEQPPEHNYCTLLFAEEY